MHDRWICFGFADSECVGCVGVFLFLTDVMSHPLSFTAKHLYFIVKALFA